MIVAHLGSGASMCAMKNGKSVDSTLGFTALDGSAWARARRARSRRRPLSLPGLGLSRKRSRRSSTRSRACSASPASATTCATCSPARSRPRASRSTTSSTAPRRRSARSPRCSAASTARVHRRHRRELAEIRRRICEASAWLGIELDDEANAPAGRASPARPAVSAWVIPTNEELMIARHTAALLGLIEAGAGQTP